MTRHSPQIALSAARRELDLARDACPHWDLESEGEGHECCYRVDDAKRAVERAKRQVRPNSGPPSLRDEDVEAAREQLLAYGYDIRDTGRITTPSGKITEAIVTSRKGGRFQVETLSGQKLFTGADLGIFVSKFWYAEKVKKNESSDDLRKNVSFGPYRESDLLYENGQFDVRRESWGYSIWRAEATHAVLVMRVGYKGEKGLQRAIAECDKRAAAEKSVSRNGRSSLAESIKIRENFRDEPHKKQHVPGWKWPKTLQEVGDCEAVMYSSNKWQADGKSHDYKHVKEGPQKLLLVPGMKSKGDKATLKGPMIDMSGEFPDSFAVLAKFISVQARLYSDAAGKRLGEYVDLTWPGCTLGAGRFADGGTFLVIYDKHGVLGVVIGEELDVLKDGIVG